MMRVKKILYIFIFCIVGNGVAFAQLHNEKIKDFCPAPETLTKQGLFWSAPGGWVSYGESFDTQVVKFIKAEWIGINVGKIICLYRGDKRIAFPIALEQKYHKIVKSPPKPQTEAQKSESKWGGDLGGYKVCVTQDIKECPFIFEKPEENKDIYEGLDFFKGKKDLDE